MGVIGNEKELKVLFVWTGVTSYMADCWRSLRCLPGVSLKIIIEKVDSGKEFNPSSVLHFLDAHVVDNGDVQGAWDVASVWRPDVVFAVGWHSSVVRSLVTNPEWRDIPKVCCFDMPWRFGVRCFAARFVLRRFLRNYSAAYVPGALCAKYASWLGFRHIRQGLFAIDQGRFANCQGAHRMGFLYVGRMSVEKRVDLIKSAHARYLELGGTWDIDYYGGDNFRGPDEMPRIYAEHACLVLASAFDPWPLVVLEAKASGCEVIMSDRCGNRFELPAKVVGYGNVEALANAMKDVEMRYHPHADKINLDEWDCGTWANRTLELARRCVNEQN